MMSTNKYCCYHNSYDIYEWFNFYRLDKLIEKYGDDYANTYIGDIGDVGHKFVSCSFSDEFLMFLRTMDDSKIDLISTNLRDVIENYKNVNYDSDYVVYNLIYDDQYYGYYVIKNNKKNIDAINTINDRYRNNTTDTFVYMKFSIPKKWIAEFMNLMKHAEYKVKLEDDVMLSTDLDLLKFTAEK